MNSYSTNLVAQAGGFKGRALQKGDVINFENKFINKFLSPEKDFTVLPWTAAETISVKNEIRFIKGNEWDWVTDNTKNLLTENNYSISNNSNRMGYHLKGNTLKVKDGKQLISSGVTFGTIQLLPDGQLIVLMADHQTTGGYPRIGHVISADLSVLAQCNPADEIKFTEVEQTAAEQIFIEQQRNLLQMQTAPKFNMEKILNAH
jgi:antagonist of KipI